VVPIDEAIAHECMARDDGVSSSRQPVIIRCRMIFTAILDTGLNLDHPKGVELDHPLQDHDRER
jgi:hypothetical protein